MIKLIKSKRNDGKFDVFITFQNNVSTVIMNAAAPNFVGVNFCYLNLVTFLPSFEKVIFCM